jgi:hypothetical protein
MNDFETSMRVLEAEPDPDPLRSRVVALRDEAERKAWDSLGRYKFEMFGYWAAKWVQMNQLLGSHEGNPFRTLVQLARKQGSAP